MARARRRPATLATLAIAIAIALSGCQLLAPTGEVQCRTDADCDGRGGDFAGSVCIDQLCVTRGDRCLGQAVPDIVENQMVTLHTRLRFVTIGGTPIAGVPVLVCGTNDETCESPVGAPVITDAAGYAYMTLWKNFHGTVQVKNPPGADYLKLKIHFLGRFETDDRSDRVIPPESAVRILTNTILKLQLGTRGAVDPNAGQILAQAADCDGLPRAGVRVSVTSLAADAGAPGFPFYFSDGIVSATATETAKDGLFGIANATEGPVTLEATIDSSGKTLARAQLWVNKDTVSNLSLGPPVGAP